MFKNLILSDEQKIAKVSLEGARAKFLNPDGTFKSGFDGCKNYLVSFGYTPDEAGTIASKVFGLQDAANVTKAGALIEPTVEMLEKSLLRKDIWDEDSDGAEPTDFENREQCMTTMIQDNGHDYGEASDICDKLGQDALWDDDDIFKNLDEHARAVLLQDAVNKARATEGIVLRVPIAIIAKICPSCADRMEKHNMKLLKIRVTDEDTALAKAIVQVSKEKDAKGHGSNKRGDRLGEKSEALSALAVTRGNIATEDTSRALSPRFDDRGAHAAAARSNEDAGKAYGQAALAARANNDPHHANFNSAEAAMHYSMGRIHRDAEAGKLDWNGYLDRVQSVNNDHYKAMEAQRAWAAPAIKEAAIQHHMASNELESDEFQTAHQKGEAMYNAERGIKKADGEHKTAQEREDDGGFFNYCVKEIAPMSGVSDPNALCAALHKKYLGRWPGADKSVEKAMRTEVANADGIVVAVVIHKSDGSRVTMGDVQIGKSISNCPACGQMPDKVQFQGDALKCGSCGKTSDMEEWDDDTGDTSGGGGGKATQPAAPTAPVQKAWKCKNCGASMSDAKVSGGAAVCPACGESNDEAYDMDSVDDDDVSKAKDALGHGSNKRGEESEEEKQSRMTVGTAITWAANRAPGTDAQIKALEGLRDSGMSVPKDIATINRAIKKLQSERIVIKVDQRPTEAERNQEIMERTKQEMEAVTPTHETAGQRVIGKTLKFMGALVGLTKASKPVVVRKDADASEFSSMDDCMSSLVTDQSMDPYEAKDICAQLGQSADWDDTDDFDFDLYKSRSGKPVAIGKALELTSAAHVAKAKDAVVVKSDDAESKYTEGGHFKGEAGTGERFDNAVKYMQAKGYSEDSAKRIAGSIAQHVGKTVSDSDAISAFVEKADDSHEVEKALELAKTFSGNTGAVNVSTGQADKVVCPNCGGTMDHTDNGVGGVFVCSACGWEAGDNLDNETTGPVDDSDPMAVIAAFAKAKDAGGHGSERRARAASALDALRNKYPVGTKVSVNDHDSYSGPATVIGHENNRLGMAMVSTDKGVYYAHETGPDNSVSKSGQKPAGLLGRMQNIVKSGGQV